MLLSTAAAVHILPARPFDKLVVSQGRMHRSWLSCTVRPENLRRSPEEEGAEGWLLSGCVIVELLHCLIGLPFYIINLAIADSLLAFADSLLAL